MRTLQIALAATILCALGCRSHNTQVLVEQEARMLEDEVYSLEAQLDECCRENQALKRANEDLKRQGGSGGSSSGAGDSYSPPAIELPSRKSAPSKKAPPKLEPPTIEIPESTTAPPTIEVPGSDAAPQSRQLPPGETPPAETTPGETPPAEAPAAMPSGDEQPAAEGLPSKMSINRRLTGGLDRDNAGGDEGIMVMVEPRDAQGRLVKTPGAVSVVLMDPSQAGDGARVARWDFQAHEFNEHFVNSTFGRGLQFELDWPGEPPQNHNLMVFVRYIAPDGTKITSDAPLSVRLASDAPRRPGSRLKSAGTKDAPRDLSASEKDDKSRAVAPRPGRQAERTEAPRWQPYR